MLSRAAFKLKLVNQTLVGTVDIDGSLLAAGNVKAPLTTALTILEARHAGNQPGIPLPLLQEGPGHSATQWTRSVCGVARDCVWPVDRRRPRVFILPVPLASTSLLTLELRQSRERSRRAGRRYQPHVR